MRDRPVRQREQKNSRWAIIILSDTDMYRTLLVTVMAVNSVAVNSMATDRYYDDLTAYSPSRRYVVEARSPDNAHDGRRAFQAGFVYRFTDTETNEELWIRRQAMNPPIRLSDDSKETLSLREESSPVDIYLSDDGWTAIRLDWDELIFVDLDGHDRASVALWTDGLSEEEKDSYVQHSIAGRWWAGYSLWYFLKVGERQLFVIRPWWGRRIVVDVDEGTVIDEVAGIGAAAREYEIQYILSILRAADMEEVDHSKLWPIRYAAYLAGRLSVTESIPFLKSLEHSDYSGSSTSGGLSLLEDFKNEIDPHSYSTFTLRPGRTIVVKASGRNTERASCARIQAERRRFLDAF